MIDITNTYYKQHRAHAIHSFYLACKTGDIKELREYVAYVTYYDIARALELSIINTGNVNVFKNLIVQSIITEYTNKKVLKLILVHSRQDFLEYIIDIKLIYRNYMMKFLLNFLNSYWDINIMESLLSNKAILFNVVNYYLYEDLNSYLKHALKTALDIETDLQLKQILNVMQL